MAQACVDPDVGSPKTDVPALNAFSFWLFNWSILELRVALDIRVTECQRAVSARCFCAPACQNCFVGQNPIEKVEVSICIEVLILRLWLTDGIRMTSHVTCLLSPQGWSLPADQNRLCRCQSKICDARAGTHSFSFCDTLKLDLCSSCLIPSKLLHFLSLQILTSRCVERGRMWGMPKTE